MPPVESDFFVSLRRALGGFVRQKIALLTGWSSCDDVQRFFLRHNERTAKILRVKRLRVPGSFGDVVYQRERRICGRCHVQSNNENQKKLKFSVHIRTFFSDDCAKNIVSQIDLKSKDPIETHTDRGYLPSSVVFPQSIADSGLRENVLRFGRIFLDFASDVRHIYPENLVVAS